MAIATTMKIIMLKDEHGSPDHVTVKLYKKDEVYDVSHNLARAFVDEMKVAAVYTGRRADPAKTEKKMDGAAPENKSAAPEVEAKAETKEAAPRQAVRQSRG